MEEELEDLKVEDPPPKPQQTTFSDGIFSVSVGPQTSQSAAGHSTGAGDNYEEVFMPCARMNAVMAVRGGTLYLCGGVVEDGDRQLTLADMYSLDLHKLEEWTTLRALDTHAMVSQRLYNPSGNCINSLWPGGTTWWHRSISPLAQIMAWCLTSPSHYLNHCWLIITEVLWHSAGGNFTENAHDIFHWYEFENNWFKTTATSPRGQWVHSDMDMIDLYFLYPKDWEIYNVCFALLWYIWNMHHCNAFEKLNVCIICLYRCRNGWTLTAPPPTLMMRELLEEPRLTRGKTPTRRTRTVRKVS